MNLNIKSTKIELTQNIRGYIEEKVAMLEKYLGTVTPLHCDFEIALINKHHNKGDVFRAEINLQLPGELLRVEKTEADLYKAIDKVKDHMAEMIKKYRGKRIDRKRR